MYCRNCGAEVGGEQRHCRKCGAKQPVDGDVSGASTSGDSAVVVTTSIFIGVCLFLMFIAGLKMMADDNYTGLIFVILGFGALLYGLLWWRSRQAVRARQSERDTGKHLDSEDGKLLASGDEQFSVTEETTRKLEPAELTRNR